MEETMALIERSHHGDKEARDRLVQENMGLVWSIVRRFTGRGTDTEDLFQIGAMGLIKAIDKFDPSFQVKFSTYAVPMIAGEIKRFLRDDGMVKVSRTLKENSWKVKRAEDQYLQKKGKDPTVGELAELTGLTPEEVVRAADFGVEVESIYKTIPQSDGSEVCLLDRLGSGHQETESVLDHLVLLQLLEELPEADRKLIKMRYLQDQTQAEVARNLGVSQVQVSRLEKKILKEMRKHFKEENEVDHGA